MLTVLITWVYAFLTNGLLGYGITLFVKKVFKYNIKNLDSILMAGIIFTTVYAQFFSLFYRVSLLANVLMGMVCLIIFLLNRTAVLQGVRVWNQNTGVICKIFLAGLILLWAYFTSRGYMHYDSDLYHAQSIRWLEEYGIVPGLGNLHERFAYNSSFFSLSALYSLKYLLGDSMHAMNGFLALILSLSCLSIAKSWKNKCFRLPDYARIGAIYYLTIITKDVVAPASDYAVMCVIFFVLIKWLDLLEEKEMQITPYALLCVVGVYTLTLKLTAGLILILLIKPAYMLICNKRVKEIFIYLTMGLITAVPWMERTVIISGWIIYPFTGLDLFHFDWKMDPVYIDIDAAQIKVWGRALYQIGLIDVPVSEWFPNWFRTTLSGMEKILIVSSIAATTVFVILVMYVILKKKWNHLDILLVMGTVAASYIFWQTSAPLIRYGYAYILLLTCIVFGWCIVELLGCDTKIVTHWKKLCCSTIYTAVLLYGCYKAVMLGNHIKSNYLQDCYIWQQDYGTYDMLSYEMEDQIIYYPENGDRAGYDFFPASTGIVENLEFRGNTMKEGFRKK